MRSPHKLFGLLVSSCFVVQLLAILLLGIYQSSSIELTHSSRVSLSWFWNALRQLNGSDLLRAVQLGDLILLVAVALGAFISYATRHQANSSLRCVYFAFQLIIFHSGFWGLVLLAALPFELLRLDGEWFAEGTPTLIASGLWIVSSAWIAWCSMPMDKLKWK